MAMDMVTMVTVTVTMVTVTDTEAMDMDMDMVTNIVSRNLRFHLVFRIPVVLICVDKIWLR